MAISVRDCYGMLRFVWPNFSGSHRVTEMVSSTCWSRKTSSVRPVKHRHRPRREPRRRPPPCFGQCYLGPGAGGNRLGGLAPPARSQRAGRCSSCAELPWVRNHCVWRSPLLPPFGDFSSVFWPCNAQHRASADAAMLKYSARGRTFKLAPATGSSTLSATTLKSEMTRERRRTTTFFRLLTRLLNPWLHCVRS
jgi:hypothetical protein